MHGQRLHHLRTALRKVQLFWTHFGYVKTLGVEVMLKAISAALRSVMFALLLLLGLVYVFAIATCPE